MYRIPTSLTENTRNVIHGKEVQDDEVAVSVHTLFGHDEVINYLRC